jgi:pilin isopeptide linkage protein
MKKFLAILLAMMLALVSVAALAEGGNEGTTGTETPDTEAPAEGGTTNAVDIAKDQLHNCAPTEPVTFTLTKTYELKGVTGVNPADVLQFTVSDVVITKSSDDARPVDDYAVSIADVTVDEDAEDATITVQLPAYDLPGIYSYQIKEVDTNIAGVTYLADTLYLNVTITSNEAKNALIIAGVAVHQAAPDGTKIDEFVNTYTSGSLTVSKEVTGNLGDYTLDFPYKATFTIPEGDKLGADITISYPEGQEALTEAPEVIEAGESGEVEVTFTLKHGQSVTFNNIPSGVSYVVEETDTKEYDMTAEGDTGDIDDAPLTAAFTNNRETTPDTGITLESMPYVLMMALSLAGFVVLKLRKREEA